MYTMTKNEIEMYVTTIKNAYPEAPEAAMDAMRERFSDMQLEDNFLTEAHRKMDTLSTAILINNLSRRHLTIETAFDVVEHFDDKRVTSQIHSQWPDEQMEERIQIVKARHIANKHLVQTNKMPAVNKRETKKFMAIPAILHYFLKPSIS